MALLGVVFALGAPSAAAQNTLTISSNAEDSSADVTLTLATAVTADTTFTLTVTVGQDNPDTPNIDESATMHQADGTDGADDVTLVTDATTITLDDGEKTGTVRGSLRFRHDDDAENEYFRLVATGDDTGPTVVNADLMIVDNETQEYTLELEAAAAGAITEGGDAATLTLTANPARTVNIPFVLVLSPNDPAKYALGAFMDTAETPSPVTDGQFGTGDRTSITTTVEAKAGDGDRATNMLTVTAYTGTLGARDVLKTVEIVVKDADPLPMVGATLVDDDGDALDPQPDSVDEGETVKVKLTVLDDDGDPAPAAEALSVALTQVGSASSSDYRLMSPITIASGSMSSTVDLTAVEDQAVDPGETLIFNASVSGEAANGSGSEPSPNILSLMINDETMKQVAVKAGAEAYIEAQKAEAAGDDGLNPGENFSLMKSMLFESPDGYTFRASSESSAPAMVSEDDSGDSIMVMPQSAGSAMITITAVASTAASSLDVTQTQTTPNVAEITFMVEVVAHPTAAPDTPAAPTVTTPKAQGALDVSWTAPNDNRSPITGYGLRYKMSSAENWTVMSASVTGTSTTLTGLSAGTSYDVQVNATNAAGTSDWSMSGTGTTAAAPVNAAPDAPAAPTVTTAKAQGALDVSWTAPNDNGSAILDYGLQYRVQGSANWTVMSAAVTGTSTTLSGLSAGMTYEVQVRARNANGSSDWSKSGTGTTPAGPSTTLGHITEISVDDSDEKDVGGTKRQHVTEGVSTKATVEVRWSHAQLRELWQGVSTGSKPPDVPVTLAMMPVSSTENWLSEAENEDVTIARQVMVEIPAKPKSATSRGYEPGTGSTTIHFGPDLDAENEAFKLYVTDASGFAADSITESKVHVIEDDDHQKIKLTRVGSGVIYEGRSDVKFDVTADPPREDLDLHVRFDLVDVDGDTVASRDNYIDKSVGTIPPGDGSKDTVTFTLDDNDENRMDDVISLHAEVVVYALDTGAYGDIPDADPVNITVVDVHNLPKVTVTAVSPSMLMEGGDGVTVTLTVDRNPPETPRVDPETNIYTYEPLTIMVGTGGDATKGKDYTVPPSVAVDKYEHTASKMWKQTVEVTVEALVDEDVENDETLELTFTVNGTDADNGPLSGPSQHPHDPGMASVTITDETEKLVWARTADAVDEAVSAAMAEAGGGDGLNPGEVIEILGAELFGAAPGVVVDYAAASSDTAVATGSGSDRRMLTVTPMAEGMAMVTVTATATSPSGATIVDQTKPNVAQIMFSVDVMLNDLTFMVMGPDEMNLAEGGMGGRVTVTTNRPVTANTEVMLMRDGSSSAGDDDYMLDPPLVTIMAGQMEGHTMVMATEDTMAEEMEVLTLFLVVDGMQMTDKSVSFYIWDAAVPALPIIAQLLLAAFLALGGYRRYYRRR